MDIDNIPFGVDFRNHISSAVSECEVLLVLIGDDWLTSVLPDGVRRIDAPDDFVRIEIEAALQRGIPVVPVLTSNVRVPSASELPDTLRPLAFCNAAELRSGPDLKAQTQTLIRQLSKICVAPGSSRPERAETKIAAAALWRRHMLPIITVSSVVLLLLAGWLVQISLCYTCGRTDAARSHSANAERRAHCTLQERRPTFRGLWLSATRLSRPHRRVVPWK